MRLIDADALMPNAEYKGANCFVSAYDIANAPTIDTSKELIICPVEINMDTDEIMELIKERGWEPVIHGQWLAVKLLDDEADFGEVDGVECSVCGGTWPSEYWAKTYFKFCPYCGAKMDGVEE